MIIKPGLEQYIGWLAFVIILNEGASIALFIE